MPTSCLCSSIQLKIASLCLASACERFAYISDIGCGCLLIFFPLGNGFPLLGTEIFSSGTNKFQKNYCGCVCREGQIVFHCPWPQFFSGLWRFPVLFPPCSQGLSRSFLKPLETRRSMVFCPKFFLQSPQVLWEAAGNLHILFCSSLTLTAVLKLLWGLLFHTCFKLFPSTGFLSQPVSQLALYALLPEQPNPTANGNVQSTWIRPVNHCLCKCEDLKKILLLLAFCFF